MIRVVPALLVLLATHPALAEETNCMIDVTDAFEKALVAGDLDGIMGLYLDSEEILAVEASGKVRRGRKGISTMYQDTLAEADWTKADFELVRTDLETSEGFCYFRFKARGTMAGGAGEIVLAAQGTWCVRNTKAGWKIVHEHMSPLDTVPRSETIIKEEAEPEAEPEA